MAKNLKSIFITYPRTDLAKEVFGTLLHNEFSSDFTMCAQETHKEDNKKWSTDKHLHCLLCLSTMVNKSKILDFLKDRYSQDYHRIHVEGVRNKGHTLAYLRKEDSDPWMKGAEPCLKRKKRETVAEAENWIHREIMLDSLHRKHLRELKEIAERESYAP